jgi:signal transduction histidine kinase
LYLVRLVAEAHGGTVAVRDRDGGGTSLIFTVREDARGQPT